MATTPAQDDPRDDGDIVASGDGVSAGRTRRTGVNYREVTWDAVNHDVEEGSDGQTHDRAIDEKKRHEVDFAGLERGTPQP